MQPAAWPDRYVCHWDKDSVDDARMVKIDFLGLAMLSVVEECLDLVAGGGVPDVDLSRIPFDDHRVFRRIQDGDTVGVFQIESRAQAQMLPRTRPKNLDDLTVQVAIVRPGPIVGGAVNPYVRARETERERGAWDRSAVDPTVAEVLEETMGVVLFQEQVVQVAMAMGGMAAGRAESFRRAMSRHDWEREREEYRSGVPRRRRRQRGRRGDGGGDVREPGRVRLVRVPEKPRRRLRAPRLPVGVARQGVPPGRVLHGALQQLADGVLPAPRVHQRRPAPRRRGAAAGRQHLAGEVHGGGWGGTDRARLRAGAGRRRRPRHRRGTGRHRPTSRRCSTSCSGPGSPGGRWRT